MSGGMTIIFPVVICALLMLILVVRVFKGKSVATIVIKPDEFAKNDEEKANDQIFRTMDTETDHYEIANHLFNYLLDRSFQMIDNDSQ